MRRVESPFRPKRKEIQILRLSLLVLFTFISLACNRKMPRLPDPNIPLSKVNFPEVEYDFGKVKAGSIIQHTFSFTNVGEAPLFISDVVPGCYCTSPEYTHDTLAPNQSGSIKLVMNTSGKEGKVSNGNSVYLNIEGHRQVLVLRGEVEK